VIPTTPQRLGPLRDPDGKVIGGIGDLAGHAGAGTRARRAYAEKPDQERAPTRCSSPTSKARSCRANDAVSALLGFRPDEVPRTIASPRASSALKRHGKFTAALRGWWWRAGVTRKRGAPQPRAARAARLIPTTLNASALRKPRTARVIGAHRHPARHGASWTRPRAYAESLIKNAPDPVFVLRFSRARSCRPTMAVFAPPRLSSGRADRAVAVPDHFARGRRARSLAALREVVGGGASRVTARLNPAQREWRGDPPRPSTASALRDPDGKVIGANRHPA